MKKYSVILSIFILGLVQHFLFPGQLIPEVLLIVLGGLLSVIYTFDSKYIIKKLDIELCCYLLVSIAIFIYFGFGIVTIAILIFWIIFNYANAFILENDLKNLSRDSDAVIEAGINKAIADTTNIDYGSIIQQIEQEIKNTYAKELIKLQHKYEQSMQIDKKKYEEIIRSLETEKNQKLGEANEKIKLVEAENSDLREINFQLQGKIDDLELQVKASNKAIEDLELKINRNKKLLDEKHLLLEEQEAVLSQTRTEREQLQAQLLDIQASDNRDGALLTEVQNKLAAVELSYNSLQQEHQEAKEAKNKLELENAQMQEEKDQLNNFNDENVRKLNEMESQLAKSNQENQELKMTTEKQRAEIEKLKQEVETVRSSYEDAVRRIESQSTVDTKESQILQDKQIKNSFKKGLKSATNEVCIISPWVSRYVVTRYNDEFVRLAKKGVKVKLIFGIGTDRQSGGSDSSNNSKLEKSRNAVKLIEKIFKKEKRSNLFVTFERDTHAKLFIVDNEWYLLGSMNLLSFDYSSEEDQREELAEKIYNPKKISAYKKEFFNF